MIHVVFGLGLGASVLDFGEDVEMLDVTTIAEPCIMLLHYRIEY